MAAKPEKVPILHRNVTGNMFGNVPGTFFGKKTSIVEVPAVRSWRFPPFGHFEIALLGINIVKFQFQEELLVRFEPEF